MSSHAEVNILTSMFSLHRAQACLSVLVLAVGLMSFISPTPVQAAQNVPTTTTQPAAEPPTTDMSSEGSESVELPDLAQGDLVVVGQPTPQGFVVMLGRDNTIEPVATLRIAGMDASRWIGYTCLTGSGRFAGALFAPAEAINQQQFRDAGGFLATINTNTRQVTLATERVAFKYNTLGCGPTDEIVAFRHIGNGGTQTQEIRLDAASGSITEVAEHEGHLSFPAPFGGVTYATTGPTLWRLEAGLMDVVASRDDGEFVDVHADRNGTVSLMQLRGSMLSAHQIPPSGEDLGDAIAEGPLGALRLQAGRDGAIRLVGNPSLAHSDVATFEAASQPDAVSLDGSLSVTTTDVGDSDVPDSSKVLVTAHDSRAGIKTQEPLIVPDVETGQIGTLANVTQPRCAVPRNDYSIQAMQPSPEQVEWAVHKAVRGQLTGLRAPHGMVNSSLPSYRPQVVFPLPSLVGGGRIPAQVLLGVLAQESNLWQAARGALPGISANPIVGNYYGIVYSSNGQIVGMNYDNADCGYGIGQITDHMIATDPFYTPEAKLMIATDYQANIAVAARMLAQKWNAAHAAGLTIGTGDSSKVESWYFALWAYNCCLYADGTVGWTNNPANSDWRFDRRPFLRSSLDDAKTPSDWPYQELALGFAETGLYLYGDRAFDPVVGSLALAVNADGTVNRFTFCEMSVNQCSPTHYDPGSAPLRYDRSFCTRVDRQCRWGGPSSAIVAFTPENAAAHSDGSEPAVQSPHPAACSYISSPVAFGGLHTQPGVEPRLPANAVIVDNVPDRGYNLAGCGPEANAGVFEFSYNPAATVPLAQIDTHQLGVGYGGHTWYAHTLDPSRVNLEVIGTWTPPSHVVGWQRVMVHIPASGAETSQARYRVQTGTAEYTRVINQRWNSDIWMDLGVFDLSVGANISLSNVTDQDWQLNMNINIAWDAMAFLPADKPSVAMVALGDSYSAGEGVEPYNSNTDIGRNTPGWKNACHRSDLAYPARAFARLVASKPGTKTFHSSACSGAVINDLNGDGHPWGELPQLQQGWLDENTTHVTIGISGNDARFAEVLGACYASAIVLNDCSDPDYILAGDSIPLVERQEQIIDDQLARLEDLIDDVRSLAPSARIVMVGYPIVVEASLSYSGCHLAMSTVWWFKEMNQRLNSRIESAAAARGARYAKLEDVYEGHGACQAGNAEWIFAVILESDSGSGVNRPGSGTFHPKAHGHEVASARVADVLSQK